MSFLGVGLDFKNQSCAVIGGGEVAYRKIKTLLEVGSYVDVFSTAFSNAVLELESEKCRLYKQEFYKTSKKYFLCVVATNDIKENSKLTQFIKEKNTLVNNVDSIVESNLVFNAKCGKSDLEIYINTCGKSPEFSRQLKQYIEDNYYRDWLSALRIFHEIRGYVHQHIDDKKKRIKILRAIHLDAVLHALKENESEEAIIKRVIECQLF